MHRPLSSLLEAKKTSSKMNLNDKNIFFKACLKSFIRENMQKKMLHYAKTLLKFSMPQKDS